MNYKGLGQMTVSELEQHIEKLLNGRSYIKDCKNHEKIDCWLGKRKYKLNNIFECTPENIEQLHRVDKILKSKTTKKQCVFSIFLTHTTNIIYWENCLKPI